MKKRSEQDDLAQGFFQNATEKAKETGSIRKTTEIENRYRISKSHLIHNPEMDRRDNTGEEM